tara:strand:+ start:1479 stop:1970 length:492 start_codon:yes stop_codon:yes gene_type:complete
MSKNVKQFKLTNNDEIVCEVAAWNDEETDEIVIKKALKIVSVEDYTRGIRFFALRPWIAFQDDPEELQSLNSTHIIVTSSPTKSMLKYYNTCLTAIKQDLKKPGIPRKGVWANLDEVNHETRDLTDDELDDYLTSKYGSMIEDEFPDSADNNIIKFKPKDTMH